MTIYGTDYLGARRPIEAQPLPVSKAFSLSDEETTENNPVELLDFWLKKETYNRNLPAFLQSPNVSDDENLRAHLDYETAQTIIRESGQQINGIPTEGISVGALNMLIERAQNTQERQRTMDMIPDSFLKSALGFAGAIAGVFRDPINIGSAFIPVPGVTRWGATALAQAGRGLAARTGIRASVGAAEGAFGTALIEPLVYYLHQDIGDDYDSFDSLMNIGFGGAFGAGLHMGVGALGDAIKAKKPLSQAIPQGINGKKMASFTPEERMAVSKVALNQGLQDSVIEIDDIIQTMENKKIETRLAQEEVLADLVPRLKKLPGSFEARLTAARNLDPEAFTALDEYQTRLKNLDEAIEDLKLPLEKVPEAENIKAQLKEIERRMADSNIDIPTLRELGQLEIELKENLDNALSVIEDAPAKLTYLLEQKKLIQKTENTKWGARISESYREAGKTMKTNFKAVPDEPTIAKRAVENPPNSRFFEPEIVAQQELDLNTPITAKDLTEAQQLLDQELANLEYDATQIGEDFNLLLDEANAETIEAERYVNGLKAMAECLLRKS